MTFSLERILENKRVRRAHLAVLPIGEKLRMLDALRERELAIRGRTVRAQSATSFVGEKPVRYRWTPD